MIAKGKYTFIIENKNSKKRTVFEKENYITSLYRYFHNYDFCYSFFLNPFTGPDSVTTLYKTTLYIHLVLYGSNFNNPLLLEEPFESKNITGKTLTSGVDFKTYTLSAFTRVLNTDGLLTSFTSTTSLDGPFSFYACMAGYNSFSHIWSALNFPKIDVADDETLFVNYSMLLRW